MTVVTVTDENLGEITSDGVLKSVVLTKPPPPASYGEYFTLMSDHGAIINIDISTSHLSTDSSLLDHNIPFNTLSLTSIPVGSEFTLTFEPPPPPPTLDSLQPNTAASGDPDFVLSCIGTGFTGQSVIYFGNEDEPTTMVNDTTLTTIVKPSLFAPAEVPVTIKTGDLVTDAVNFTFSEPITPEEAGRN